nr:hypothetical protein [Candidatus Freyarchaeota archaeon]
MSKIEVEYKQVDIKSLLDFCIVFIQNEEKMYGPVYTRLVKKYAVEFVAKRLGEEPPEGSDEWDWPQVKEYLEKNLVRYPYIFNAIVYAGAKTEITLQGKTGTSRIAAAKVAKQLNVGQHSEALNLAQAWKQTVDAFVTFKVMPPDTSYSIEDENTIKIIVDNCPFKDSCDAFIAENITRFGGGYICGIGQSLSYNIRDQIIADCDFAVQEFSNPKCTVRIVKIP